MAQNLWVEIMGSAALNARQSAWSPEETTYIGVDPSVQDIVVMGGAVVVNGHSKEQDSLIAGSQPLRVEVNLRITHTVPVPWSFPTETVTNEDFILSLNRYDWQIKSFELRGTGTFDVRITVDPNRRVPELAELDNQATRRFRVFPGLI